MVRLIGHDHVASGGDELDGEQVVDGQAVTPGEEADAAGQGDATDADLGRVAEARGKTVFRQGVGVLAGGYSRFGPGGAPICVDVEPLHVAEVEQPAVGRHAK